METMILVAGLAFAGLAGIAAAFYFSMRPGGSGLRAGRPERAADRRTADVPVTDRRVPANRVPVDRVPVSRSRTSPPSAKPGRTADPVRSARSAEGARSGGGRAADRTGSSTVIDFTGPQRALDEPEPVTSGRRARHGDRGDDTPDEAGPGRRAAARRSRPADREAEPEDTATAPRSRRRVGWRKGSDVDEEMWPVEGFGGVSDEQFWDDLAADKPLATTARTAQPEAGARRRPPNAGPLPDLYPADGRGRGEIVGGRGGGRDNAAEGPGTHPQPRLGPDDRTAIQPAQTGPQPSPLSTQPVRTTQPVHASHQPVHQPAEPRGRQRAGAEEDPLTSPAYSLRPRGSVDGRGYSSSRRSGDLNREQYAAAAGGDTQSFNRPSDSGNGRGRSDGYRSDPPRSDALRSGDGYGGTAPATAYPYPQPPYTEPTQAMSAPPYGERYGYENPVGYRAQGTPGPARTQGVQAVGPSGDTRRANGGWRPGQGDNNANGDRGSRPAYPPVNGYRGPQDARDYDRRLSMR
jgi:hypothetical protein